MMFARCVVAVCFLIAMSNCVYSQALPGANPNIIVVDPKSADISRNAIHMQLNEPLSIGLPNSSGTGYIWSSHVANEKIITSAKIHPIEVKRGNEPVVGYRVLDVFVVSPMTIGTTEISFSLKRPGGDELYSLTIPVVVEQQ